MEAALFHNGGDVASLWTSDFCNQVLPEMELKFDFIVNL
jgi:hypothetical protein